MATATAKVAVDNRYLLKSELVLTVDSTPMPLPDNGQASSRIDYKVELVTKSWSSEAGGTWLTGRPSISSATLNTSSILKDFGTLSYSHRFDSSGSATTLIARGSSWVGHNKDGTIGGQTVSVTIKLNGRHIENYPAQTLTATVTPDSIIVHRPSTLTISTTLVSGQSFNGAIANDSPNSSDYTHKVSLNVNGSSHTLLNGVKVGSHSIAIPSSIGQNMSGTSASGVLTIETFNGQDSLGKGTANVVVTAGNTQVPTSSTSGHSVSDTNATITNLQLGTNRYVSSVSNIRFTLRASSFSARGGKTISKYGIELRNGTNKITGQESTSSTIDIVAPYLGVATSLDWYFYAIDSGGLKTTVTKGGTLTVLPYLSPTVNGKISRNNTTKTTVDVSLTFHWTPLFTSSNVRKTSLKLTPAISKTEYGSYTNVQGGEKTITDTTTRTTTITIPNIPTSESRYVQVTVSDGITRNVVIIGSVGTESVPLDLSMYGAGVGIFHDGNASSAHLQVGQNGISTTGKIVNDVGEVLGMKIMTRNLDLNTLTKSGIYIQPSNTTPMSITNHPTGDPHRTILHVINAGGAVFQIAFVEYNGFKIYMRVMGFGKWGSWSKSS